MRGKEKVDRSGYLFSNRDLTALLIPLVIEQLLSVLVGMADSIMVASVGEAAVSGVSLVDNIMVLLINVFAALATGGAVVAGQYLGQKQRKKASQAATELIWFITICAVVITILIYLCKSWILHGVFGKIEEDVMRHDDCGGINPIHCPVQWRSCDLSDNGKFGSIYAGIHDYECHQCDWKCSADLWFSPGDRRRGNSDSHIQNDSGDFDCNALNASGSGGIHGAFAFLSFRLEDD